MTDIRSRARLALRTELADALFDVFAAEGFDNVTVDEAARRVGISRATFFRHFSSKEDAVVSAVDASRFDTGVRLLTTDAQSGDNAWSLVRRALDEVISSADDHADRVRARVRMMAAHDSLRRQATHRRTQQRTILADALRARGCDAATSDVVAGAALAVLDIAWEVWAVENTDTLAATVDRLFATLGESWRRPVAWTLPRTQ